MKPTSILGRYLIKQILINFIAVLLMVTGVILMFEIIELLRRTADRPDVDMIFVMKMAFSKMPRTFEMVFPFIMMIAAMTTTMTRRPGKNPGTPGTVPGMPPPIKSTRSSAPAPPWGGCAAGSIAWWWCCRP